MMVYWLDGSYILKEDDRYLIQTFVSTDGRKMFYRFSSIDNVSECSSEDYNYIFYGLGKRDNRLVTKLNGFMMERRLKRFMKKYN